MASLNPRSGALGKRLAAHLLRRSTYKITHERIIEFAAKTAEQAVSELFTIPSLTHPEGPINYIDGNTAWLTTGPYSYNPDNSTKQRRGVQMWIFNEMIHDNSIRHKMAMYFHSIFVTENDTDWRYFDHYRLFQQYALGNIKTIAKKVTMSSKMLRYLNNNVNSKNSPNENYAREFMELFTILKGPQIGNGNYTNYTEYDIQQAARVLTGFKDSNFDNKDPETGLATGYPSYYNHDKGNKTFSAAFQNQTILGAVDADDMFRELDDFIDMLFGQMATARSFVRRLYRFFVSDRLNPEIESAIINPLAQQLYNDNYDLENTLKTLLKSQHFYDEDDSISNDEIIGGKLKSPLELYLASLNMFDANNMGVLNANPVYYNNTAYYLIWRQLHPMGFPDAPLSVEGYPGFYKAPGYSKFWIDQATIPHRYRIGYSLLSGKTVYGNSTIPFKVDTVQMVQNAFANVEYADQLMTQFLELCLPEMPDTDRYNYFKEKLLGSLSPVNWYFEWHSYTQSGDPTAVRIALDNLFDAVVSSPECQTF